MRIRLTSVFVDDQEAAEAFYLDGIPFAQFTVDDVHSEFERLTGRGVTFTQPPTDIGTAVIAVLDDTCGNLIQLIAPKPDANA
jgi:hypothetical protein